MAVTAGGVEGSRLGCHVVDRADHRVRACVLSHVTLGQAKVCEAAVVVRVEQDVLGLEVAVRDAQGVQVNEREHDLRREDLRDRLRQEP